MDMNREYMKLFGQLSDTAKGLPGVKFAFAFRAALNEKNYYRAFKLINVIEDTETSHYRPPPFMSACLVEPFLDRLRARYILLVCRSHYQASLLFFSKHLGLKDPKRILEETKVIWTPEGNKVSCKPSVASVQQCPLLQRRKVQALG